MKKPKWEVPLKWQEESGSSGQGNCFKNFVGRILLPKPFCCFDVSKLFHGNSRKEQANPKKWNNRQKPTVSATHLELSRCQPDMDFSQALRLDELCKGYKKEVHQSWSWIGGESSTQTGRWDGSIRSRKGAHFGGGIEPYSTCMASLGILLRFLCIGFGWFPIRTPNYWGFTEFHQTCICMFHLVQKVGECREFLLSVGTLTSKVRKGSKLRHWMIWPQLVYPEILFRTFSGFVELINDHLIKTTGYNFLWHGGFRVVFASLFISLNVSTKRVDYRAMDS